jgi:hypothetical protein
VIYFSDFSAAGGGGGHRYWRINVSTNHGNAATNFVEVEMRETPGGSDVTGSGTASGGGGFTGGTAASAFDNNEGTAYIPTGTSGWLKYDFGSGNAKDIVEVALKVNDAGFATFAAAPKDFTIEWSDDDSSWTVSETCALYGPLLDFFHVFPEPAPAAGFHRFWRIFCLNNNGGTSSIILNEIEMRATAGGADQCPVLTADSGDANGRVLVTSGDGAGFGVFDNNTSGTPWAGAGTTNRWVGMIFPTAVKVEEVALTCSTNTARAPNDIQVEYSDDEVTWTNQKAISNLTWSSVETKVLAAI